jgi:hypothetical protein
MAHLILEDLSRARLVTQVLGSPHGKPILILGPVVKAGKQLVTVTQVDLDRHFQVSGAFEVVA